MSHLDGRRLQVGRGGRVIVEGDHPGSTYVIQELLAKVTRLVTATIQRAFGAWTTCDACRPRLCLES